MEILSRTLARSCQQQRKGRQGLTGGSRRTRGGSNTDLVVADLFFCHSKDQENVVLHELLHQLAQSGILLIREDSVRSERAAGLTHTIPPKK